MSVVRLGVAFKAASASFSHRAAAACSCPLVRFRLLSLTLALQVRRPRRRSAISRRLCPSTCFRKRKGQADSLISPAGARDTRSTALMLQRLSFDAELAEPQAVRCRKAPLAGCTSISKRDASGSHDARRTTCRRQFARVQSRALKKECKNKEANDLVLSDFSSVMLASPTSCQRQTQHCYSNIQTTLGFAQGFSASSSSPGRKRGGTRHFVELAALHRSFRTALAGRLQTGMKHHTAHRDKRIERF